MIGLVCQMVGLETDNRNVFPNDRIGFPHSLLARLCRDDAGAGLKAKKISARPAVVPRGEVVRRLALPYFSSGKARLLTKFGE